LPAPTWSSLFPETRWFLLSAVPRSFARPGSSFYELHILFRVFCCHLPFTRKLGAPSLGFRSPSRQQRMESTKRRASHTRLTFRPQRFSRSRRLTPPRALRACFIPQPRPGFALQGFSPLPSQLTSSMSRALMALASFSSRWVAPPLPVPSASTSGL
jgi:hypothetical protein